MRVVQLEAESAARAVEAWQYIRKIDPDEIAEGKWFSYGPHVIWWLVQIWPGDFALHICVEPGHRRLVYGRKLTYAFEVLGEILRADRLLAWLSYTEVETYVSRLGWERDPSLDGVFDGRAWYKKLAS